MSILDWDDEDNADDLDIGTGTVSLNTNELTLNAQLSSDPLSLVNESILSQAQVRALERLKVMGLEKGPANSTTERISRDDKMTLGGGDVNQLIPLKYDWAWQKYLDGCANNWMPTEIAMGNDIKQWKAEGDQAVLTDDERRIIYNTLGFFSTADTVVNNNLLFIALHIKNPEMRQFIFRQIFEESMHAYSYQYIIESLNLNQSEVFNQYRENLSMAMKDNWCFQYTSSMECFQIDTKDLLRNLIAFYVVMEGIFFYCGFSSILALGRSGKMMAAAEQFQYIMRDETTHLNFGIDLINTIKHENPEVWTAEFQEEVLNMIEEGSVLETVYGYDINPNGCMVINPKQNAQYMQFIARRRCEQLGLNPRIPPVENPFPWMSEMIEIRKEKNFFETKVNDYQVGADLKFDEA